jgi:hypothetical protein
MLTPVRYSSTTLHVHSTSFDMLRIHTSEPLLQLKLAVAHSRSRKPFFTYSVRRCSSTSMLSFARSSMTPVFLAARGYILLLPSETHHCYPLLILHLHIIEPSQHLLRGILCIHRTAALKACIVLSLHLLEVGVQSSLQLELLLLDLTLALPQFLQSTQDLCARRIASPNTDDRTSAHIFLSLASACRPR